MKNCNEILFHVKRNSRVEAFRIGDVIQYKVGNTQTSGVVVGVPDYVQGHYEKDAFKWRVFLDVCKIFSNDTIKSVRTDHVFHIYT